MFSAERLATVRKDMNEMRLLGLMVPDSFVKIHEEAARADLERFAASRNVVVGKVEMVRDGWGDGMRVLQFVGADFDKQTFTTYSWGDANGGSWWEVKHGKGLVEISPVGPGHL